MRFFQKFLMANSCLQAKNQMLEGINYLHAKFKINILKNKKVIKLLELWTLWLKKKQDPKI